MIAVVKPGFIYIFVVQFCSEINPSKLQLQQIKQDELAGEIFDLELELAYALIHGVEVK
jgi:putative transposase